MRHLNLYLVFIAFVMGLFSCTNNNDGASIEPVDSAVAKTIIVDVRTVEEWEDDGHAGCSVNYPLAELDKKIESLKAYDKIVVVCRSGSRAEVARELLEQAGIGNVENKGAWQNITCN
jgi:phage shock protein E